MSQKNLEDAIQAAENPVSMLRKSQIMRERIDKVNEAIRHLEEVAVVLFVFLMMLLTMWKILVEKLSL